MDSIIEAENAEGTYQEDLYAKKTDQFASRLRKSSKKNETELNIIKVQYSQVQEQYLTELKRLESEIKKTAKRCKQFDGRRNIEASAFTNDIQTLRKRVTDYERHIKRLKLYVDKEDTDALVHELKNQQLTELDLGKLADEIHKIDEEVEIARRFKPKHWRDYKHEYAKFEVKGAVSRVQDSTCDLYFLTKSIQ